MARAPLSPHCLFRLTLLALSIWLLSPAHGLAAGDQAVPSISRTLPPPVVTDFQAYLQFMAVRDRSPGSSGLEEAAALVASELTAAGLTVSQSGHTVLAPRYQEHVLELEDGTGVPLYPLPPNGPVLASPGPNPIQGPVQWAGRGGIEDLDGTPWQDRIALVDMQRNALWASPFEYGAAAVILVPSGKWDDAAPYHLPYLHQPADLPRFLVSKADGDAIRRLLPQRNGALQPDPPRGTIRGSGTWEEAHLPHLTAVIQGSHPERRHDTIMIHADLDRTELIGGHIPAASEATSAALLLALARHWAVEPLAETVVVSFGSGRSRSHATLRHWLSADKGPAKIRLFVGLDLADGGEAPYAFIDREGPSEEWLRTLFDAERHFRVSHDTPRPSVVAAWHDLPAVTLTTTGYRAEAGLGLPADRLDTLDIHLLVNRGG